MQIYKQSYYFNMQDTNRLPVFHTAKSNTLGLSQ